MCSFLLQYYFKLHKFVAEINVYLKNSSASENTSHAGTPYLVTIGSAAWLGPHLPRRPRPVRPVLPLGLLKEVKMETLCEMPVRESEFV